MTGRAGGQFIEMFVEIVAFVNFQRRGRKLFTGYVGGTDILATVAHDTGIGINQLSPRQILDFGDAEFFVSLIGKVDGR